jgi:hypothetical protein
MTTRIGKIGRLPKNIRHELGRRIEDGQPGSGIAEWLHAQPAMRQILLEQFAGHGFMPQNEAN